jgi:uncharacterized protein (TIGR02145 family)
MKKNKLFGMVVLIISIILALSFTACPDGGGGGGGGGTGTAPTITTASLPDGTAGTAYSQTLMATGDTPITWNIESGALPGGLTLSAAGVISGNPTTANTFTFTVKATNATGSKTKPLSITIAYTDGDGNAGTFLNGTWSKSNGSYTYRIVLDNNNWTYYDGNDPVSKGTWTSSVTPAAGANGTITLTITQVDMGSGWVNLPAEYNSLKTCTAKYSINSGGNQLTLSEKQLTAADPTGMWSKLEGTYTKDGGGDTPVTLNNVTANGTATQTTTQLTLTFSQAITGLSAADITLTSVSGVTKGTLSNSGTTYTLPITVTVGGALTVAVSKTGYTISGSPKTVTIYYSGTSGGVVGSFTDSRDGTVYKTVTIGTQTWLAENLKYNASGSVYYNNDSANGAIYGRLYNWETAKTACPSGWHLPSDAEWTTLTTFVGTNSGTKLKANSSLWSTNTGTDEFGFSALPGGVSGTNGSFSNIGNNGYWWSVTEYDASNAYHRYIHYSGASVYSNFGSKTYLFSIRCVKD